MQFNKVTSSEGNLSFRVIRKVEPKGFFETLREGFPQKGLPEEVNSWRRENLTNLLRGAKTIALARMLKLPHFYGMLHVAPIYQGKEWLPFGLASFRVVTTVGAGFIVDAWQNTVELETMKYHALGTGSTAEAVGETALVTELTTEYNPDNTRATGSLTEGATANIFKTVGTNVFDATVLLREHGIMSQAATGGGVLFDRSLFALITLGSGDSFETTYEWTMATGG